MQAPRKPASRTRALLGLALLMAVLLFVLALLEGPNAKLGCSPIAPASADTLEEPPLQKPLVELDAPPKLDVEPQPVAGRVASSWRLHGRVLDTATSEPIPWLDLHISIEGGTVEARTQADGSFNTDLLVVSGRLEALVSDDGATIDTVHANLPLPNETKGWEIRVPIGPTFPIANIDDGPPDERGRWKLRLVETQTPQSSSGVILVSQDKLSMSGDGKSHDWGWKALRFEQDSAFVRWPKVKFPPNPTWVPRMSVRSDIVCAKATLPAIGTVGIQPALSIITTPFTVLSGNIGVPAGWSLSGTHVAVFDPIDEDKKTFESVPFFAEFDPKEDGQYRFEVPAHRTYRVQAWRPTLLMAGSQVVAGQNRTFGPDLDLLASSKPDSRVRLAVPSGDRLDNGTSMWRFVPSDVGRFTNAMLLEGERPPIELPSMAIGNYRIESIGIDEGTRLTSVHSRQMMPAQDLDPAPKDTPVACVHRVLVRAPGAGEKWEITAGPEGSIFMTRRRVGSFSWNIPPDNPAVITVWCNGFSPALLTEDRFLPRGEERVAETTLSPGWGTLLAFRAGDPNDPNENRKRSDGRFSLSSVDAYAFSAPPLPGVRVETSGSLLGTSDREGCVLVSRMPRPDRLTLVAPGWHMCALTGIPGAGSRWWVWMKRDE